jgi:hypothetical protein
MQGPWPAVQLARLAGCATGQPGGLLLPPVPLPPVLGAPPAQTERLQEPQTPFWHVHWVHPFTQVEFGVEQQLPNAHGLEHAPPVAALPPVHVGTPPVVAVAPVPAPAVPPGAANLMGGRVAPVPPCPWDAAAAPPALD